MSHNSFKIFIILLGVLIQTGCSDKTTHSGFSPTPLGMAVEEEDLEKISNLISEGEDINAIDHKGWTALMLAAKRGVLPIVELLIAQGGDVNLKNNMDETALEIANRQGHTKIVSTLVKKLSFVAMCQVTQKTDLPDLIELELTQPEDHCVDTKLNSSQQGPLDVSGQINIRGNRPIGGLTFLFYEHREELDRIDFTVEFKQFDPRQNFYLQFYQSRIGKAPFYFGIQNRVPQKDHLLLLSRWFDDEEIAKMIGLLDVPECSHFPSLRYDKKVTLYHKFFQENPHQFQKYEAYLAGSVEANEKLGGFTQFATYETSFAGIRLPKFPFRQGATYTFSIIQDWNDSVGTWYQYWVTDELLGTEYLVGSVRFPKGAKIAKKGQSWTEIYTPLYPSSQRKDSCQYYEDLPKMNFVIKTSGNGEPPIKFKIQYGPNEALIPQQRVDYVPDSGHFHFRIGSPTEKMQSSRKEKQTD